MWRNLKFPSLCVQFMVFCCILRCFVAKSLVVCNLRCFSKNRFVAIFPRYCVEKILSKISDCGEISGMVGYRFSWNIYIISPGKAPDKVHLEQFIRANKANLANWPGHVVISSSCSRQQRQMSSFSSKERIISLSCSPLQLSHIYNAS